MPTPYRHPQDARTDYPYRACLVHPTGNRSLPAAWAFARKLDSGEVEILYDGAGTVERLPGSCIHLRPPPVDEDEYNPASAAAWDQALGKTNSQEEDV